MVFLIHLLLITDQIKADKRVGVQRRGSFLKALKKMAGNSNADSFTCTVEEAECAANMSYILTIENNLT